MAFDHPSRNADFYARRINHYVAACKIGQHINMDSHVYTVNLGNPYPADTDGILDGVAADDTGPFTYYPDDFKTGIDAIDDNGMFVGSAFGCTLSAVGSASGVTQDLTVVGYDYLGQKITKTIAMNGTTPIAILVAFKWIESITIAVGAASETIDVGFTAIQGLPFKTSRILAEVHDGVSSSTLGTLTVPVLTDPATVATLDPRGVYTPNATMDGAKLLTVTAIADPSVNAAGNGGLHGIRHYAA